MVNSGYDAYLNAQIARKMEEDERASMCSDCHQHEWVAYYNDEYRCEHCIDAHLRQDVISMFKDSMNCVDVEIKSIEPVIDDGDNLTHLQVIAVCDEAEIEIKIPMFWI